MRGGAGGLFILGLGLELVEIGQNVDGKADRWAELVYRVKPLRVPRPARLPNPQTKPERRPPLIDVKVEDKLQRNGACFAADTPIRTPGGWAKVQDLKAGDRVLARSEVDAEGPVEAKEVLDAFATTARVWHLHAGGRVIATTAEHPLWVRGRGWAAAWEVRPGDSLAGHDGRWVRVDAVVDTGEHARVYNVRVADHQTYFVGCDEWGFSVWAHNVCVYRGLSLQDTATVLFGLGITSTQPGAKDEIYQHVEGITSTASDWISATKSEAIARRKYGALGVVAIDLDKVPPTSVVDISNGIPARYPTTTKADTLAKADEEVVIFQHVPAAAISPLPP